MSFINQKSAFILIETKFYVTNLLYVIKEYSDISRQLTKINLSISVFWIKISIYILIQRTTEYFIFGVVLILTNENINRTTMLRNS